jgi:hypothetical protein
MARHRWNLHHRYGAPRVSWRSGPGGDACRAWTWRPSDGRRWRDASEMPAIRRGASIASSHLLTRKRYRMNRIKSVIVAVAAIAAVASFFVPISTASASTASTAIHPSASQPGSRGLVSPDTPGIAGIAPSGSIHGVDLYYIPDNGELYQLNTIHTCAQVFLYEDDQGVECTDMYASYNGEVLRIYPGAEGICQNTVTGVYQQCWGIGIYGGLYSATDGQQASLEDLCGSIDIGDHLPPCASGGRTYWTNVDQSHYSVYFCDTTVDGPNNVWTDLSAGSQIIGPTNQGYSSSNLASQHAIVCGADSV